MASSDASGEEKADSRSEVELRTEALRRFVIAWARKNVQNMPVLWNKEEET